MRVLFINEVCGTGSTGKITCELAEDYEREGHEVKIAYGRSSFVPEKYRRFAVQIGSKFDVYAHALLTRLTDRHGFYSKHATRKFLRWANSYNPSFLWLHNIHGYYINIELLFDWIKSRDNLKVFWTLHDCWSFTGHCAFFTMAKCEKWRVHCENCPQKNSYPKSFHDGSYENYEAKRRIFTGVHDMRIITPSQWLAELVKQSFLKEYPVEVRNNKIDTNIFKPSPSDFREKYNLTGKFIVLGVASVWDKRKGLEDFVKLSKMLDPEKFAIFLVGLKPEQIKTLPKNILAISRTNNQRELAEIYTAADVFFNPTYEDNYPTVNLEAEACGTPVLSYDTGGSPETLHDVNSRVIKTGDIDSARKIIIASSAGMHQV
ncbi:MAG: glycosyltransferase [Synergistaceae bacterium]|nr:glycosyltransferase [Synergistaceae bacterium]